MHPFLYGIVIQIEELGANSNESIKTSRTGRSYWFAAGINWALGDGRGFYPRRFWGIGTVAALFVFAASRCLAQVTLPASINFESNEGYSIGALNDQLGWNVSQGSALVTAQTAYSGSQSMELVPGGQVAVAVETFASAANETVEFCDFYTIPVAEPAIESSTLFSAAGAEFGFQQTNGQGVLEVFQGNGSGGGSWVATSFTIPLGSANQANSWIRLTARLDFGAQTWSLYANGSLVAIGIPFVNNTSAYFSTFQIQGDANTASYVDDIYVGPTNPLFTDTNNNGIPDSWEMQYLGNLSYGASADPGGVGRTILQSYEQGLSPWPAPIVASGLQAWYRADEGVLADSNENVSQWTDLSGNGYHVFQSAEGEQPQLLPGAMNGNPSLRFDTPNSQIDYYLTSPAEVNLMAGSNDVTVIAAFMPAATQGTDVSIITWGWNGDWYYGLTSQEEQNTYILQWTDGNGNRFNTTPISGPTGQIEVISTEKSGTTATSYLNGATVGAVSVPEAMGPLSSTLTIGSLNGQIGEVLVYNRALTDAERQSIESALMAKYIPVDSNNNGIPDTWEMQYLGNLSHGANDDPGGVGRTILQSYQQGLSPWPAPIVASGLQAWYRADEGVVTDSNNNVNQWTDLSGNGYHVLQNVDVSRAPLLVAGALNGNPAVQFAENSYQQLTTPVEENLEAGGNDITLIAAVVPNATQGSPAVIFNLGWGSDGQYGLESVGYPWRFVLEDVDSSGNYWGTPPVIGVPGQVHVISEVKAGTSAYSYLNGTLQGSVVVSANMLQAPGTLVIGNAVVWDGVFNGQIAEILAYNRALTDAERQSIESALMAKYIPVDSNNNGIPDTWEMQYLGNLSHGANDDPGGVGRTLLQSYQQGLSPWPAPTVVNGLQAWYRADEGVVADPSFNVSEWADISGNANHVYQTTNSNQEPLLVDGAMNGSPAVLFGANSSQALVSASAANLEAGNNDMTIITVIEPQSQQNNIGMIYTWGSDNNAIFGSYMNTLNQESLSWSGSNGSYGYAPMLNTATNMVQVLSQVKSGTIATSYINGASQGSNAVPASMSQAFGILEIGNESNFGWAFTGTIAEILVYNRALTDAERQSIESALMAKYIPVDSNNNGIPDTWEMQYLGNLSHGANDDPGGVGRTLLQSYQQGLSPWPAPTVVNGLQAWYRADEGVVTDSNNNVSQWTDLSGNGYHVFQQVPNLEPVSVSGALNGNPAVQFGANQNQRLATPLIENIEAGGSDVTVISVVKQSTPQTAYVYTWGGDGNGGYGPNFDSTGSCWLMWSTGTSGDAYAPPLITNVGQVQVISQVKSGTLATGYINGGFGGSIAVPATMGQTPAIIEMGNELIYNNNWGFNGQIAEVLVYNRALTDTERQSVEAALIAKYIPVDSNGNGIPDSWEMQYLGNLSYGASADPGGVGRTILQSYQQGLSPWPAPVVASGLQAWYRADEGVVVDSNNNVSQWTDLSGNGFHVIQNQASYRPQLVAGAMDGNPAVQYAANKNQELETQLVANFEGAANDFTVITVINPAAAQNAYSMVYSWGGENGYPFGLDSGANNAFRLYWQAGDGSYPFIPDIDAASGQPQVLSDVKSGTTATSYLNGVQQGSATVSSAMAPIDTQFAIGNWADSGNSFVGQIAEVLVYNRALSDVERQSVESALAAKYLQPPPVITSVTSETGIAGFSLSYAITASNSPTSYAATGLPSGLSINSGTGVIAGSATTPGIYPVTISATNAAGSTSATLNLNIIPGPPSGELLWLRADAGVTTGSNGAVNTWQDQSGHGNNATQTNSAYQPSLVPNAQNGLPVVQFSASGTQWFNLPQTLFSGVSSAEAIVVVQAASATPSAGRVLWQLGSRGGAYPNTLGNVYETFGSTSQYELEMPATNVATYRLYDVSAQANGWTAWIDGVQLYNNPSNQVSFASTPLLGTGNGSYFDGDIAEVIIYPSALTPAQRATVDQYLQFRYSLPGITVPANPTGLQGNALSATQVSLDWSDAPTTTGITYTVWRQTGSGAYAAVAQVNNALSYVDSGLTAGTSYSYEVSSSTFAGPCPGYSNTVTVTTLANGTDIPLSNISLWLAADSGALAATSGNVGTWQDQSGKGNDAIQFTQSYLPIIQQNGLNGRPVIQFAASNTQWFSLPQNLFNGMASAEVFAVVKAASATPSAGRVLWQLGSRGGAYPNTLGNVYETFGSTSQYELEIPGTSAASYRLFDVSAQANGWTAWIDGVQLYNNPSNQVSFASTPLLGTGNGSYFDGDIAEVIIFNAPLSSAQRATVSQYLDWKYNLPGIAVPANPTDLQATAVSASQISLVWSDAPTTTGITYTVWRQTGSGAYAAVAQVNNALSYVDTGLTAGTSYNYEISSNTFAGPSPGFSNAANVTTLAAGTDMPFANLDLWLVADGGALATSNGNLGAWQDRSGNGFDATQFSASLQPKLLTNALNGRPVMQFTASNSQYFNLPQNLLNGFSSGEVFVVVNATTTVPSAGRGLWHLGSNGGDYPYVDSNIYECFGSTAQYKVGVPPNGVSNYSLYDVSAQANAWSAMVDGVQLYSNTTNQVSFASTPYLGTNGSSAFDGEIAEMMIFNTVLSAAQRATVSQYLQNKYNLAFGIGSGSTDGVPNSWLLQYFGTTNVNPALDYDGNGNTVAQDYAAGIDPVDIFNGRPFIVLSSGLGNIYSYDLSGRLATASYANGVNVRITSDAASNVSAVTNYGSIVQWRIANNLPPDGTGNGGDSVILANDGMPNVVKYALGLAASTPAPANDPVVTVSNPNGGFLTITYTRPDPAPNDIAYTVRVSPDGVHWSSGSGATVALSTTASNGIATVIVRDNTPVYAPSFGRQIQLVIQRVPAP